MCLIADHEAYFGQEGLRNMEGEGSHIADADDPFADEIAAVGTSLQVCLVVCMRMRSGAGVGKRAEQILEGSGRWGETLKICVFLSSPW